MTEKQLSLHDEDGWRADQRLVPKGIEEKPELLLAWRGLVVSISAGQMTRQQGFEMLKHWEKLEHLHDVDANGDAAA